MSTDGRRLTAVMEALLVTLLWSTSYVLIKIGLGNLPPLTFAAYRYVIASAVLLVLAMSSVARARHEKLFASKKRLLKLFALGISGYSLAQGLQYMGLFYLPAVTVTFLLNFTPVIVLFLGIVFLQEFPMPHQVVGLALTLLGAYFFFLVPISAGEVTGVMITLLSGLGWAVYMIMSRHALRVDNLKPLSLTAFSMGFGAAVLLVAALSAEGPSAVSVDEWITILWLSLVNTALAFVLWNHALERLKAFELSILQNTMLIQIAILAWIFLGEQLTPTKVMAMIMVFVGALMVQITRSKRDENRIR